MLTFDDILKHLVDDVDDILNHSGVLGMRWGYRKAGTGTPSSHKASPDSTKASSSQSKVKKAGGTHVLSNDELQHLVNRMNLEKQYSTLSTSSKSSSAGTKFLKEISTNVLKKQLTAAANDALSKQIKAAMKSKGL